MELTAVVAVALLFAGLSSLALPMTKPSNPSSKMASRRRCPKRGSFQKKKSLASLLTFAAWEMFFPKLCLGIPRAEEQFTNAVGAPPAMFWMEKASVTALNSPTWEPAAVLLAFARRCKILQKRFPEIFSC
jgi:hypothetical protein